MTREIHDFAIRDLRLASGALMNIRVFDEPGAYEQKIWFSYMYRAPQDRKPGETPDLENKTTLTVEYDDGIAQDCTLDMDAVFPKRLGKVVVRGMDVTPGARINIRFNYKKQNGIYRLKMIDCGLGRKKEIPECEEEGLVKQVNFPFPVRMSVEKVYGGYCFPFLRNDNVFDNFTFMDNIQNTREGT